LGATHHLPHHSNRKCHMTPHLNLALPSHPIPSHPIQSNQSNEKEKKRHGNQKERKR
jgi:hypothetical protein